MGVYKPPWGMEIRQNTPFYLFFVEKGGVLVI